MSDVMTEEMRVSISTAGNILAPFYMMDPAMDEAWPFFQDLSEMNADALAQEWPFGEVEQVKSAFGLMIAGAGEAQDKLSWEFRRLFVGPQKKAAPPWGSVYTDHEGVMFGETTIELRQWMRQHGLKKAVDEHMPEDHIGYMLMLMSFIAHEKPEILGEYLSLHLLTWSHHFFEVLKGATTYDFYRGLAQLSDVTLQGIQNELGLEVETPRFFR